MFINIKGKLIDLLQPRVMGILNLTPDSFFQNSRKQTEEEIIARVFQIREEGADIIDVGGYSSRPNAKYVSEEEEIERLDFGLGVLFREFPEALVSIDTFRSKVARRCVEKYGVSLINDISAGELDREMFDTIADLKVPYIMMHMKGSPQTMMQQVTYDNMMKDMFLYFSEKINSLHRKGVNDIILDPGFGFSKNTDQNYYLMKVLKEFRIFELPILVGISRKTMIRDLLDCSVDKALNGTSVLNTIALAEGASILRVHDVKEAMECIKIYNKVRTSDAF
ncbi:MAG: dihydropteroate synthase [Dysgonamonadaceae bacterium]|jgi:dihydropteroate synthase|nr:dihydropteroate synthase [Dysgonamonadaceae bacterium]